MRFQQLILCEKPSVAREIAAALGITASGGDYIAGRGIAITWCFGHLLEACEPHEYNKIWEKWTLEALPIIPTNYVFNYKPRSGDAKSRLRVIGDLARESSVIVNACDAGREGELIFREVIDYIRFPIIHTERMWLNTMTKAGILLAWNKRQSSTLPKFENLGIAARVRSQADWLVGTNGTRAATLSFPSGKVPVWSVGRVQTAVLNLIVDRDQRINSFIPEPYYGIRVRLIGKDYGMQMEVKLIVPPSMQKMGKFTRLFKNYDEACHVRNRAMASLFEIWQVSCKYQTEKKSPPPLFKLVELQKFCSLNLGWTAKKTLEVAQEAYERKLITYPRTDSAALPQDYVEDADRVYRLVWQRLVLDIYKLKPNYPAEQATRESIFNDAKVSDHFAIIPTDNIPEVQPGQKDSDVTLLWKIVSRRFLLAFAPIAEFTDLQVIALHENPSWEEQALRALSGASSEKHLTTPGWYDYARAFKQDYPDDEPDRTPPPPLEAVGTCQKVEMYTDFSERPDPFKEDTLLSAMDSNKLGTSATRAATIETLLSRKYVTRKLTMLLSTEHGQFLITELKAKKLEFMTTADTTKEWETQLDLIETGDATAPSRQQFLDSIKERTEAMVAILAGAKSSFQPKVLCPITYQPVEVTSDGYVFPGLKDIKFPLKIAGREMTAQEYKDIIRAKEPVGPYEGFFSKKTGKNFKARIALNRQTKKFEFAFK